MCWNYSQIKNCSESVIVLFWPTLYNNSVIGTQKELKVRTLETKGLKYFPTPFHLITDFRDRKAVINSIKPNLARFHISCIGNMENSIKSIITAGEIKRMNRGMIKSQVPVLNEPLWLMTTQLSTYLISTNTFQSPHFMKRGYIIIIWPSAKDIISHCHWIMAKWLINKFSQWKGVDHKSA